MHPLQLLAPRLPRIDRSSTPCYLKFPPRSPDGAPRPIFQGLPWAIAPNNSGTVWPAGDPTPSLSAPLTRTRRSPTELFRLTHPFAHIQTSKQHQARRHRRLSRPAPILQPAQAPRCRLTLSDRLSRRAAAVRWACADLASCRSDYARASSCVSVCWMSCRVCLRAADRFLCVRWAWTESGTWTGHGEFAEQGPGKELGVCRRLCGRGLGRRGRRGVSRACLNGWSVGLRRCV